MKFKDLSGKRFGRLVAVSRTENSKSNQTQWLCKCDCGETVIVRSSSLLNGHTKSCGCYSNEIRRVNTDQTTHGKSNTRLYRIWAGIKARCTNPHVKIYPHYGGRGIALCSEWLSFDEFYRWSMGNGNRDDLSIDRVDVNGNYTPDNCRWVDHITQMNNTRRNCYYEFDGKRMTITQIERIVGLPKGLLTQRLHVLGMSLDDAINRPVRHAKCHAKVS